MSLLQGFTLFLIATVLAPYPSKQSSDGLDEDIDWGLGRNPDFTDGDPENSDYPDDDAIAQAFMSPGKDKFALWVDLEETEENILNIRRFTLKFEKYTVWNCYPLLGSGYHFLEKNPAWDSDEWAEDFHKRTMLHAILEAEGGVHLISRPGGPRPDCYYWHKVQFSQLRKNERVDWIDLYRLDSLEWVERYWTRGDPDPESKKDPDNPNRPSGGEGGGRGGNIISGGGEGGIGNIINEGGGGGSPDINSVLGLGTAVPLLGGGAFGAAVLEGVPPAVGITRIGGTDSLDSLLDGVKESTSTTTPPDWTDVIEHPNHLGDGWHANIPSESFGDQAMALPDGPSNPPGISQDNALLSRDLSGTCSLGTEWQKMAKIPWNASPRSSNGGSPFRIGLAAFSPPAGALFNQFIKPLVGGAGNVLTVHVIQTRLQQTPKAEAGICHLDVTILGGSNSGIIASGKDDVGDSLEFRVAIPNLQTALFLWWTGSNLNPIHFRYGKRVWDSSDSKCQTVLSVDDKREVSCQFTTDNE